jgi:hypothetical protein
MRVRRREADRPRLVEVGSNGVSCDRKGEEFENIASSPVVDVKWMRVRVGREKEGERRRKTGWWVGVVREESEWSTTI